MKRPADAISHGDDDLDLLIEEAKTITFRRKSIHQSLVEHPDGRRQAANSNQAPFAPIAAGGKGAKKYQCSTLCFLDRVWDFRAPCSPGEDGHMRARPSLTAQRCLDANGKWRSLICFLKEENNKKNTRYYYLGTYKIALDEVDGSQMIGEFDEFVPYEPTSPAGRQVFRALKKEGKTNEEALDWLQNPSKWRSTIIEYIDFDSTLFETLKRMEENNQRR